MKITICGGGNAAHVLVPILKAHGADSVNVYTPFLQEVEGWRKGAKSGGIRLHLSHGGSDEQILTGAPDVTTSDPGEAVDGVDMVLIAAPAFAHEPVLEAISPYLEPKMLVGTMPARGGLEYLLASRFSKTSSPLFFGTQTLPWACRILEYGVSARVLGQKKSVGLATWPTDDAGWVGKTLQELTGVKFVPIPSMRALTLSNMGQLLHPGIMYGLFHDWDGTPYQEPPLFYQGVDEETAALLSAMSDEVRRVAAELGEPPGAVPSLYEWLLSSYDGDIGDAASLHRALTTNAAYDGLRAPMASGKNGFLPDFKMI
jgi:hypothetical protein